MRWVKYVKPARWWKRGQRQTNLWKKHTGTETGLGITAVTSGSGPLRLAGCHQTNRCAF